MSTDAGGDLRRGPLKSRLIPSALASAFQCRRGGDCRKQSPQVLRRRRWDSNPRFLARTPEYQAGPLGRSGTPPLLPLSQKGATE